MEITLETIYQQQLTDKAELKVDLKSEIGRLDDKLVAHGVRLESKVDSVKSWCIGLMLSTILVVAAITTTALTSMLLAR